MARPASCCARRSTLLKGPALCSRVPSWKLNALLSSSNVPETFQWLLVPVQDTPQDAVGWQAFRLPGSQDPLAVRASKKLKNDERLIAALAGTRLRMELDRVPLWRGGHVPIRQVTEDFARYLYLPRLVDSVVLRRAIENGLGLLTWESEAFGYADSVDETTERYRGLRGEQHTSIVDGDSGLLVRPEVARRQMDEDAPAITPPGTTGGDGTAPTATDTDGGDDPGTAPGQPPGPGRFHGSVKLDATRVGRDASRIADEVIAHLSGLVGAKVTVTLDVEAEIPSGAPDHVVRTVTENSRTLKFTSQGFESE